MKTLILGLGNTILSDDGVGIRIIEELQSRISDPDITVSETNVSGLSLLDIIIGYDKVIIVDAIQTVGGKPGTFTSSPRTHSKSAVMPPRPMMSTWLPPSISVRNWAYRCHRK